MSLHKAVQATFSSEQAGRKEEKFKFKLESFEFKGLFQKHAVITCVYPLAVYQKTYLVSCDH
jgi:hypothetical protein